MHSIPAGLIFKGHINKAVGYIFATLLLAFACVLRFQLEKLVSGLFLVLCLFTRETGIEVVLQQPLENSESLEDACLRHLQVFFLGLFG